MAFSRIFYKEFNYSNSYTPARLYSIYFMKILVKIDIFFTKIDKILNKIDYFFSECSWGCFFFFLSHDDHTK